jgi:hypothetical protein
VNVEIRFSGFTTTGECDYCHITDSVAILYIDDDTKIEQGYCCKRCVPVPHKYQCQNCGLIDLSLGWWGNVRLCSNCFDHELERMVEKLTKAEIEAQ